MTSTPSLTKFSRAFNRQSVQGAIRSLQTSLARYKSIPPNGIALFAGVQPIVASGTTEAGTANHTANAASSSERERLMVRDIEPIKPLRTGLYHCGAKFQVTALLAQLNDSVSYGFVVLDGAGCYMYNVAGDTYTLVWKHGDPALPKKHGRGGQSAPRFGRLRQLARAAWISLVAKQLNVAFTDKSTGNVTVEGIVLCGSGELKQQLAMRGNVLDDRVAKAILPTLIDLQYGGRAGIQEAIKKAAPLLNDHSFSKQRDITVSFMEEIANDSGLVAYGAVDTMYALQSGAVSTLLISETLAYLRVVYRNEHTQEMAVDYAREGEPIPTIPAHIRALMQNEDRAAPSSSFGDLLDGIELNPNASVTGGESGTEWRIETAEPLIDYLVANVSQFGAAVQIISPAFSQGAQFNTAFGGIGGILRWTVSLPSNQDDFELDNDSDGGYDFDF